MLTDFYLLSDKFQVLTPVFQCNLILVDIVWMFVWSVPPSFVKIFWCMLITQASSLSNAEDGHSQHVSSSCLCALRQVIRGPSIIDSSCLEDALSLGLVSSFLFR